MNKTINAVRRSLNLSQKEIEAYLDKGYRPVTFVGENLQPFHVFAKADFHDTEDDIVLFHHMGEVIHARFSGERLEGWFKKTKIAVFEILDTAVPRLGAAPQLLTA